MTNPIPIKAVIALATGSVLVAQADPNTLPIDKFGRLSLDGALIVAVAVLWRYMLSLMSRTDALVAEKDKQIATKDSQIIDMARKTTEVMTLVMESVKESRKATEELGDAMDNIAENVAALQQSCADQLRISEQQRLADQQRRKGD